jgi:perosamine synthetase
VNVAVMKKKSKTGFKRFDDKEKKYLGEVIDSGQLFYVNGDKTKKFCNKVQDYYDMKYCTTASSGTAAIHAAIGALEIPPGKEVITSPITDMGTLIGALYQNLIPVFADVDPNTYNISASAIDAKITDNTGAIIVVHLAGNPAQMDAIMDVANKHGIPVIEDCAQSYGALFNGKKIGTIGKAGCYSLNAYKHISAGDGGFVITNDKEYYEKVANFADKSYDRLNTGRRLTTLAPNYRITELQTAVALAQMDKLDYIVERRHAIGDRFNQGISGLDGIEPHKIEAGNYCSYWFIMLRVNPGLCTRDELASNLKIEGIPASSGYIEKPLYMEPVFARKSFFPGSIWPAETIAGRMVEYTQGDCPVAEQVLETAIRINIDETMTEATIDSWIDKVKKVLAKLKQAK